MKISRRPLIKGGIAPALMAKSTVAAARRRANILWLVSEDNNLFVGADGDKLAHRPAIDALARDGEMFRIAWAPGLDKVCTLQRRRMMRQGGWRPTLLLGNCACGFPLPLNAGPVPH